MKYDAERSRFRDGRHVVKSGHDAGCETVSTGLMPTEVLPRRNQGVARGWSAVCPLDHDCGDRRVTSAQPTGDSVKRLRFAVCGLPAAGGRAGRRVCGPIRGGIIGRLHQAILQARRQAAASPVRAEAGSAAAARRGRSWLRSRSNHRYSQARNRRRDGRCAASIRTAFSRRRAGVLTPTIKRRPSSPALKVKGVVNGNGIICPGIGRHPDRKGIRHRLDRGALRSLGQTATVR